MVDAIVSVAAENLLKMAGDEAVLLMGVHKELHDLSRKLSTIRAVLQDAEMKQIREEHVRIWLQNLKYVAYEIEDMVEAWDQVRNSPSPFSCMVHPFRHSKFGHKVKTLKEKLAKIVSEKDEYHLRETQVIRELEDRQTYSFVEQSSVIGRDGDTEMLRRKLIEENLACRGGGVPVIAIVGMGGVGKTTLAQVVFNSETIKNHFEKRTIWVCISNNFNVKDAMISIVNNGGGSITKDDGIQVELVQNKLLELIENKRYLLVLDDVWNENELEWEPLQRILNRGADGSRIVVTTRNRRVAIATRSDHIHDLGLLPEDECWSIFKNYVFVESNDGQEYKDLEKVGKQIVEKCGGLPLAVKTIASVVRKNAGGEQPTREQLENILNNEIWDVSIEGILPALMLSYIELPSKLKNCFCYCSLFEKDFVFKRDLLTKMWVAQGYIVANDVQREESIAEEYIRELLHRSLFQEPEVDKHGSITSCKMHDHVHDLAQWVTKTEFSVMEMKPPENRLMSLEDARHCAILGNLKRKSGIALTGVQNLRTLIYFPKDFFKETNIAIVIKQLQSARVLSLQGVQMSKVHGFERLVHVRYLDLSHTKIKVMPKSIGKLKELRYLDLSNTKVRRLPKTITWLSHLQMLNLSNCWSLRKLPDGIPGMGSLRHLDVFECERLKKLPDGIERLTLLQTLSMFPVVVVGGGEGGCSNIGELGGFNRLRGRLAITNLGAVGSHEEVRAAKIQDKTSLVTISLRWRRGESPHPATEGVLESLHPPPTLEELGIVDYPGRAFPSWVGDASFLLLHQVHLSDCKNCTQLPPLGQLPCLKRLSIDGLLGVKEVGGEFLHLGLGLGDNDQWGSSIVAFPQLEYLAFSFMESWERWAPPLSSSTSSSTVVPVNKEGNADATIFPRLMELVLEGCFKLEGVPPIFTTALQTLRISFCSPLPFLQFLPPSLQHLEITADQLPPALLHLTDLQTLRICGCDNLRTLPEGLMGLTNLQSLRIIYCKNLRTLPEGLTNLQFLFIFSCKNLRTLPEGLTNLQELEIRDCGPKLSKGCKVGGCLWPRIAHIPHIEINREEVQNNAR